MNRLSLDRKGNLIVTPSMEMAKVLNALPTARRKPRSSVIGMKPSIEIYRKLLPYLSLGSVTCTPEVEELFEDLDKQHRDLRRSIRKAEAHFKKGGGTFLEEYLKSTLMNHQGQALGFSLSLPSSALFMEQGTGKSLTDIAWAFNLYKQEKISKLLITCPKGVIPVWKREYDKHLKDPSSVDLSITRKKVILPDNPNKLQILVINFDKLKKYEKVIKRWKPDAIAVDESHRLNNRTSQRSKVMHRLGDLVEFKQILTGTPIGQDIVGIWSQFRFLNADIFGRNFNEFKDRYLKMGGYYGHEITGYKNLDEFSDKLHSISFRCTKDECLDLPERTFDNFLIEPDATTKRLYQEMDKDLGIEWGGEEIDVEVAVARITKLRQITGGMIKSSMDTIVHISNQKIDALREILEGRRWDKKVVVYVSFKHEIRLVQELSDRLKLGYLVLSGSTSDKDREDLEKTFREDDSKHIMILQVDTGGEGLEFTAANLGIFYSPTFSAIKYHQCKDRIHRYGQDSKVSYINLVMEGTIDEEIVEFIVSNGELTDSILEKGRNYKLEKSTVTPELEQALEKVEKELENQTDITEEEIAMSEEAEVVETKKKPSKKKTKKAEVVEATETETKPKKAKKAKAEPETKVSVAAAGYTGAELAAEFELDASELRKHLRALKIEKPGKQWAWAKKTDPALKEIRAQLKERLKSLASEPKKEPKAKKAKAEPAEKKGAAKKASPKKATAKKTSAKKTKK